MAKSDQTTKTRCSACLKNLSYYFTDYSGNSSVHGLKFLGERKRSAVERIWWLTFLFLSLYFCITLIRQTYQKWERSPVIISFSRTETEITKLPFPAITVCPYIKAKRNNSFAALYNMTVEKKKLGSQKFAHYNYMALVCPNLLTWLIKPLPQVPKVLIDSQMLKFLIEVQPGYSFFDTSLVSMGGLLFKNSFKPFITSEGVCHTFNMLDLDEIFTEEMDKEYYENFEIPHKTLSQWSLEGGYTNESVEGVYPHKGLGLGEDGGLTVILRAYHKDIDHSCTGGLEGFKVILHHPAQTPNANHGAFRIGVNQVVSVSVKPNMITTSEQLVDYAPQDRKCYFASEKKLRFFKTYNQQDCMLECLTNFTYQYCECVQFFMPRDNSTPICGVQDGYMFCAREAGSKFVAKDARFIPSRYFKAFPKIPQENLIVDCKCLPGCSSLDFEADVTQVSWNWRETLSKKNWIDVPVNENDPYDQTKLHIFYKDIKFITLERNELYGQTDFYASCGGLLGLFIGFSLISAVEVLYYCTLRLFCNCYIYGKTRWSGVQNE